MDQDAFRSLLSAPRTAQAGPSRAVLGAPAPKRGWGGSKSKDTYDKAIKKDEQPKPATETFTPRNQLKKVGGKYKDRAEARRLGLEDEYKPVEQLLEDFEKRKAEAGAEAEKIEEQRAYLGGDATHSILVKGLDYALLAARKAELEREKDGVAEEELEAFAEDLSKGKREKEKAKQKVEPPEEKLGNRFKSIAQKKAEAEAAAASAGGLKKKKKKKKIKVDPAAIAGSGAEPQSLDGVDAKAIVEPTLKIPSTDAVTKVLDLPKETVEEEEEDIFGGVGEYKLEIDEEDDEDDQVARGIGDVDQKMDVEGDEVNEKQDKLYRPADDRYTSSRRDDHERHRDRSPSRQVHRTSRRSTSRSRSRSRSRENRRHQEYSPDDRRRYDSQRTYSDGRESYDSRHDASDRFRYHEDRYRARDWEDSRNRRNRDHRYRSRSSSRSRDRYRHDRRGHDRSDSRSRSHSHSRHRSRSPSPRRRPTHSRSLSPAKESLQFPSTAPTKRPRSVTRSPTPPLMIGPPPELLSGSDSDSEDDQPTRPGARLQPLQSSAIADLRGFLAADEASAAAEDRKLKKARWRAQQGLGVQEGVDLEKLYSKNDEKEKEKGDKLKLNRDYQMIMNVSNKKKEAEGGKPGEKED